MRELPSPTAEEADRAPARRGFLGLTGLTGLAAGLAALPVARALGADTTPVPAAPAPAAPTTAAGRSAKRDVAILRFLAAAELIETDLWQQYAELAQGNPGYRNALAAIDDDLPTYTIDITEDEHSHAEFINAYLKSIGEQPVNLDAFRTIPPPKVTGLRPVGRLTNLTDLTVDTSYFTRYQSTKNPDFGASFPQIAKVRDQPAIPTANGLSDQVLGRIARVAALHFPSIEQGGTSLYDQFVPFVTSRDVLRIVSSIYAAEAIHYAIFRDSLTGVTAFNSGDGKLVIPDLTNDVNGAAHVMPKRCDFLDKRLPTCSVVRPSSPAQAGARATIAFFADSNLFKGQNGGFFSAVNALAKAADGVG